MLLNRKHLWYLARTLGLALSYVAAGLLGLQLLIPPNYASPLYPAAGLALAALLSLGLRYAPGVALGAFAVNVLLSYERGLPPLLAPTLIGLGAGLQALAGAWAVRRWVAQPLLLSEPRDLAKFFLLGAGLACTISPTVGVGALLLTGSLGGGQALGTWGAWWMGDTMGVLIAAPIALTLIGRPRKAWAPRRLSVGLPLLLTTLLMAMGTMAMTEWDAQRARSNFERDALSAAHAVEAMLREPLMALEAGRSLLLVAPALGRTDFERGTSSYLRPGSALLAMGLARRISREQLTAFEREAEADGLRGYRARDRQRPGDFPPQPGEDLLAIRLIEPLARNRAALGVNIHSIPVARVALEQTRRSGRPAATAGFQLSQDSEDSTGVVVYQALYAGQPVTEQERVDSFSGVVFTTLRPDQLLRSVAEKVPGYLALCLIDTAAQAQRPVLAGPADCAQADANVLALKRHRVQFGSRDWEIRVLAPEGVRIDQARSWPFALVGLAFTGLLGVLLLTVSGRARRVEALVLARTSELKREVAVREQGALALQASEQRFRNIFDQAPVGIVFTDVMGAMQEANPYFCRLVGYPLERLQQLRSVDITHPDDRAEDIRLGMQLLRGEIDSYRRNKRYHAADGQVVQVRAAVSLLRNSAGKPHRLVGVVEDIADQLKLQELARVAQAAAAANQAKNEFLSRMSHELRTPLNAMLGFTQLLELDDSAPLSKRQRGRTAQIQQAGWHLLEMINDTLDLSRIESGSLKLAPAQLSLDLLLDEALAMVEADAAGRRLSISRALAENARHVFGDATRIKQVLINLLSNAVKYNVEGGSISISSRPTAAATTEIRISDSGLGLSAEQLEALFQPFNRLGREHSGVTGTGIGLVISKRLAELMGGDLQASSPAGEGASFVLTLPSAPAPAPQAAGPDALAQEPFGGKRRLVYVEDNAVNAEVMRGVLEQRPQIELEIYATGAEGLAAVLAEPPDLLLLDMQLPDMDGLQLLQALRASTKGRALTVVVVSANALQEQIRASRAAGVQHYLTKPIDVRELLGLLDSLLGAPA